MNNRPPENVIREALNHVGPHTDPCRRCDALVALDALVAQRDAMLSNPVSWREETWKMRADAAEAALARAREALAAIKAASFIQHAWQIADAALDAVAP